MLSITRGRSVFLGRPLLAFLALSLLAVGIWPSGGTSAATPGQLASPDIRFACQTAVEEVYWQHREWPALNPRPKPALAEVMPAESIAAKAADSVRYSNALEQYWQTPITGEMLQAEMARQAANTKDSEMLREVWAALNDDPLLIAECLARPLLARRLVENWQAADKRFSDQPFSVWWDGVESGLAETLAVPEYTYQLPPIGEAAGQDDTWADTAAIPLGTSGVSVWTGTEMIFLGESSTQGHRYNPTTDTWETMTTQGAPVSVFQFTAVWSGTEMITWGGCTGGSEFCTTNQGGRYNPATDSWTPTSTSGAPIGRRRHGAVWSGTEMIVWGGCREDANGNQNCNIGLNSGGRYNPTTNSWQATSLTNAPAARNFPDLVWAGDQMILWSGTGVTDPGRRYVPATNTWLNMSTANAPTGRDAALVWTGTEMVAWGGCTGSPFCDIPHADGGRYNPDSDSWIPTSAPNAPSARSGHGSVWTGSEMIVWGGTNAPGSYLNNGARYNPVTNSWAAVTTSGAPVGRANMAIHWTGNLMLVWGGVGNSGTTRNGARYNPATNSWTPMSAKDPNSFRYFHTAIWTGTEMIAWGGEGDGTASTGLDTGRIYDPATDSWSNTSLANAPSPRDSHSAIWTGMEMIIWGGDVFSSDPGTGGRYNPLTNSWTPTNDTIAPPAKANHSAVWTGSEMIVFGGSVWDFPWNNTGSRYNPSNDSWTAITNSGAPSGRYLHSAVWTGSEMLIWGGAGSTGLLGDGARYNPTSNTWMPMSGVNAPTERSVHVTVWTGTEMVVWGGTSDFSPWTNLNSGGRYNPANDSWTPTTTNGAPAPRARLVGVWTGDELIVWSGCTGSSCLLGDANGGRYDPATDSWTATTLTTAPEARQFPTAVWTGEAMLVWGGNTDRNGITHTGGLYFADTSGNSAPAAMDDAYELDEDETLTVNAPGVLGNDSDPDGDPLSAELVSSSANGSLTLSADGSFTYTPDANFNGVDSFTYQATDGQLTSNAATVTLTVNSVNDAPVANDDSYVMAQDMTLVVAAPGVLGNDGDVDGDPLTAALLSGPANGTLVLNTDGSFTYTPDAGFSGVDSFTYTAEDGNGGSDIATVTITVNEDGLLHFFIPIVTKP